MASRSCVECGKRSGMGYMSTYSAWYPERDKRVAYLTLHCIACAPDFIETAQLHGAGLDDGPRPGDTECQRCGGSVDGVWCVTYLTVFMPHKDRLDIECWDCEKCALSFRSAIQSIGKRLPERAPAREAASGATSPWDTLGLEPA